MNIISKCHLRSHYLLLSVDTHKKVLPRELFALNVLSSVFTRFLVPALAVTILLDPPWALGHSLLGVQIQLKAPLQAKAH